LKFINRFSKNCQISNLIKLRPVGDELFHAKRLMYRQTDIQSLIVAFRSLETGLTVRHFARAQTRALE